ncbi:MAG: transposase [Candidatus Micrarchaeaceae archaeon]
MSLLEAVILSLASAVVKQPITAAIDSTGFGTHILVSEVRAMKEILEHAHVKLHVLYDAERLVFLMAAATSGDIADSTVLMSLVGAVIDAVTIARMLGDPAYSSRENVQFLADLGIEPVIPPNESAGALAKGHSAWRRLILEFMELGVERWVEEKGYGLRFTSESIFSALKLKFGWVLSPRLLRCELESS